MPGFDRLRFPRKLPSDLFCLQCEEVFNNPLQCTKCQLILCSDCFEKKNDCEHQMTNINKFLLDKLSSLDIKCKNWFNGCDKTAKLPNISSHEKKCEKTPNKSFNDQEDLLFECPDGCKKLCSLPEIKGKHSCIEHLLSTLSSLSSSYNSLFSSSLLLSSSSSTLSSSLSSSTLLLSSLLQTQQTLKKELDTLKNEKQTKIKEIERFSIERMGETFLKIKESFGEDIIKLENSKGMNEEGGKEFRKRVEEERERLSEKNVEEGKKLFEDLRGELLDSLEMLIL